MHKISGDKYCWEVEGTLYITGCIEYLSKKTGRKIDICRHCIYYKEVKYGYHTSEMAG